MRDIGNPTLLHARWLWQEIKQGDLSKIPNLLHMIYGYGVPTQAISMTAADLRRTLRSYGLVALRQVAKGVFTDVLLQVDWKVKDRLYPLTWESFGLDEPKVRQWVGEHGSRMYKIMRNPNQPKPELAFAILELPYFCGIRWDEVLGQGAAANIRDTAIIWLEDEFVWLCSSSLDPVQAQKRANVFWSHFSHQWRAEALMPSFSPMYDHPVLEIARRLSFTIDQAKAASARWWGFRVGAT